LFDPINLRAAIEQRPDGCQAMFLLDDVHGYDHNGISRIRGCSVEKLQTAIAQGMQTTREELRVQGSGSE
jgi:DNA-directed RNA polymerase specialized sigma24 family protein